MKRCSCSGEGAWRTVCAVESRDAGRDAGGGAEEDNALLFELEYAEEEA